MLSNALGFALTGLALFVGFKVLRYVWFAWWGLRDLEDLDS